MSSDDSSTPVDPISELRAAAVQLHELHEEWLRAGFTADQAIYLVGQVIRPHKPTES